MDLFDIVISGKINRDGGGGDVTVEPLSVLENGVYSASSGYAFDPVTVSVPQSGITPTGTKDITSNGIYDVGSFASASVNVPIPSGYIQPQGTSSITQNGIYDITSFASVDVNVSGGGGDHTVEDGMVTRKLSGAYENSRVTEIGKTAFMSFYSLTAVDFANVTLVNESAFSGCSNIVSASFPKLMTVGVGAFYGCRKLPLISLPITSKISANAFNNCFSLYSVILLYSDVVSLANNNAFNYTPLSSNSYYGDFGSIYVPASLVDSYKAAANWSAYADRITSYVE